MDKEMKESKKEEKNSSKGKKVIIILLILVIIGMGVAIYLLLSKPEPKRDISEGLVVDNNIDKKASDARFTTDMNMIWTFPAGSAVSTNAEIGNSKSNLYECYFEVILDDEEQTLLYSSPVLPVGKRIEKLELNQALPAGAYDAVCIFHVLDDEDPEKELGTVALAVSLMFVEE